MDIQAQRLWLIQKLAETQNDSLINKVYEFYQGLGYSESSKKSEQAKKYPGPESMEELVEMLKRSEEDIEAGRVHTTQEVLDHVLDRTNRD